MRGVADTGEAVRSSFPQTQPDPVVALLRRCVRQFRREPLAPLVCVGNLLIYSPPVSVSSPARGQVQELSVIGYAGGGANTLDLFGNHHVVGVALRLALFDVSDPDNPEIHAERVFLGERSMDIDVSKSLLYLDGGLYVNTQPGAARVRVRSRRVQQFGIRRRRGVNMRCALVSTMILASLFGIAPSRSVAQQIIPVVDHLGGTIPDSTDPILIEGATLFFGLGAKLYVVDIGDPQDVHVVGSIVLPARIWDLHYFAGHLYVSASLAGLRVVDVTDPTMPQEVGAYSSSGWAARGLFVSSARAYVMGSPDLRIIDVSSPENPQVLGQGVVAGGDDLYVLGNLAYIPYFDRFSIYDVKSPALPKLLGQVAYPANRIATGGTSSIQVIDGIAYFGTQVGGLAGANQAGFHSADVSEPSAPVLLDFYDMTTDGGGATGLSVVGGKAFVVRRQNTALQQNEVVVLDVSNPSSIFPLAFIPECQPVGLYANAQYLVTANTSCGPAIKLINVVDVQNPSLLWEFSAALALDEARLFGDRLYGVLSAIPSVVDVTAGQMTVISQAGTTGNGPSDYSHPYLFVATNGSMNIFDMTNLISPILVGFVMRNEYSQATELRVSGSYAYVASTTAQPQAGEMVPTVDGGIVVVDIAVPSTPVVVGTYDSPGNPVRFELVGTTAYVADSSSLRIVDMSDPASPSEIASISVPALSVFVEDETAYVTAVTDFRTYSVSDPANPTELGTLPLNSEGVTVKDGLAYVAGGELRILDVRNPAAPVEIATTAGFGNLVGTPAVGSFAYVHTYSGDGTYSFAIPPPPPELDAPAPFINADGLELTGQARPGAFVAAGGGLSPAFQQLIESDTDFTIPVVLKQSALNTFSVTTMNEFGLVSLPAIARVVEGPAFPSTPETVTGLAITPNPAPGVALNDSLAFTCTATFSDASMADVTEFVTWEEIGNGELITEGGLYVNTKSGSAQVRAFVAGVFSNVVTIGDE